MAKIGKYEIESLIGHGGMGDVYRAFDPTVRRPVAIKVLKVEGDPQMLNRFRLEATAAGNLNHPNIVTIHDYGEHEGKPYLVMEYLEGQDLQQALDAGQHFDLAQVADIMSQVADALECAHQHGVIHRDIKPANIMLLNRGGVKLMDFGIARLAGENTQQTKTGYLIGTVLYMSPEQFQNLVLDARVDIWAYGLIYYQLLAGKHPFAVPEQLGTMYNIAHTPAPSICNINQEVPEGLGQIVDRCLSKDREQRHRTMEDLRFDTLPLLQDLSRQQAARMLGEARILLDRDQLDPAMAMVRRVLDLDPGERTAHALRKTISEEIRMRTVRPQVESLLASAEEQLAARQPDRAVEFLENAFRLDPTSTAVSQKLTEAREMQDWEKRVSGYLAVARKALETNDLDGARANLTELVRADPDHEEGSRLLASTTEEIQKRDRQRVLQEGLAHARSLVRSHNFGDAVQVLTDLVAAYPGTSEAAQLLREAEAGRAGELRRLRLQQELSNVNSLVKVQKYEEAIQRVEPLTLEFPAEDEFRRLLSFAREEWKVQQRVEALERVKNHIVKLHGEGRFDEALRFVERGLGEFPDETDLLRLSQKVLASKAEAVRRTALEDVQQRVRARQRAGELMEALRLAEAGLREHGADKTLLGIREELERDWETTQRNAALGQALAEGRGFLDRGEFENAISHFRRTVGQFAGEPEPKKILAEAEAALARQEKAAAQKHAEREALAKAAQQKQAEEARQAREREAKLEEARRSAQEEQQKRILGLERAASEINAALAAREYPNALKLARAAAKSYPDERKFATWPSHIEADQREAKIANYLASAYAAIGRGDLNQAEKQLADARKVDPAHSGLKQALLDVQTERSRQRKSEELELISKSAVAQPRSVVPEVVVSKRFPVRAVVTGALLAVAVMASAVFVFRLAPKVAEATMVRVSPDTLDFSFRAGDAPPDPMNISISGTHGANFSVRSSEAWIQMDPLSGKLPANLSIAPKIDGIGAGVHEGTVEISAGAAMEKVTVKLTVAARPGAVNPTPPAPLAVSPDALSYHFEIGGPEPRVRQISVSGAADNFEAKARDRWVSVSPASGGLPGQLTVSVRPEGLSAGDHFSQISVNASGSQKVVSVQVTVASASAKAKVAEHTAAVAPAVTPSVTPAVTPTVTSTVPPVVNPDPPDTKRPSGIYLGGRRMGDLAWIGTLAPGAKVVIGPRGVLSGGGRVVQTLFPDGVAFDVSGAPTGVQATAEVNRLTLVNNSGAPVSDMILHWKVK